LQLFGLASTERVSLILGSNKLDDLFRSGFPPKGLLEELVDLVLCNAKPKKARR